jgi:DNA polymerase I-like protein with 3'-5' exonuclease and polymerase domains
MADALVEAEAAGLCPVLTVHDEIVCEVSANAAREAEAELERTMTRPRDYAPGFPVAASGFVGRRYRK